MEHINGQVSASDFLRGRSATVDKPGVDNQSCRVLLVFQLSDRLVAVHLEDVERIAPMAELATPPGLPAALEGVLNLAGAATPVLRLDRLFGLPPQRVGLYSTLIILKAPRKAPPEERVALLADHVREVLPVAEDAFVPVDPGDSLNGCATAAVRVRNGVVHVLSPPRILLAKEREALAEFQAVAQRRLQDWEATQS